MSGERIRCWYGVDDGGVRIGRRVGEEYHAGRHDDETDATRRYRRGWNALKDRVERMRGQIQNGIGWIGSELITTERKRGLDRCDAVRIERRRHMQSAEQIENKRQREEDDKVRSQKRYRTNVMYCR